MEGKAKELIKNKVEPVKVKAKEAMALATGKAQQLATSMHLDDKLVALRATSNKIFIVATTTRLGVTLTLAALGAAISGIIGAILGTICGLVIGFLLALFTFGLSIPAGGFLGFTIGATVGTLFGGMSGALLGYTGFTYRKEAQKLGQDGRACVMTAYEKIGTKLGDSATRVLALVRPAADSTMPK